MGYFDLFSCTQMNMRSLVCLWATGPVSAYQCAEAMQAAENSACTMYEVFSEAFLGFFRNKIACSFVFSFQETLENILWEQGSKTNFMGTGNMVILKITFREHGRLFLGRAYLVGLLCTHLGSA